MSGFVPAGWQRPDRDPGPYTVRVVHDARCHCGRPVPASSGCGCCCAEHDNTPARDWARQYGLELDRCDCGRAIPGDVTHCDDCDPDTYEQALP